MSGWLRVALADVVRHRKEFVTIDDDRAYRRCRVQTSARGVVLRDTLKGLDIKTKTQQVCRGGEFLVAEIDAKMGGYGLVPSELDGAIVSSHYFLFAADDERLNRAYLDWYSKTPDFFAQVQAVGSTNYAAIRPGHVLGYTIPLPPLDEQRLIVARLDGAAARVEARRLAAAGVERELAATLRAAFARITADAARARMGDIAPLVRRPVTIDPDAIYPELGVRSFGRGLFAKPNVTGSELTWQSLFRIEEGDLVFSNIKAWEGAFAVAGAEHHGKHGSHRYLTCVPDAARATPGFLHHYLQSEEGLDQIGRASPGSADRNRTFAQKRMEAITIPIPPLDAQRWFDRLQDRARAARAAQTEAVHLDCLLPAMLHEAFGE